MKAVSKAWRAGLECLASRLHVQGTPLPPSVGVRYPLLTSIDLRGCSFVTPGGLRALGQLRKLTSLALRMGPREFIEPFVAGLRGLTSLARLDVDLGRLGRPRVTDTRLRMLHGLPVFRLDLSKQKLMKPASLALLEGFPGITNLVLPERCRCKDEDLEVLQGMAFESLTLNRTWTLTDFFLGKLRGLSLRKLHLGRAYITDAGLEVLRGMPITDLNLGDAARISDDGLLRVLQGMQLTALDLGCNACFFDRGITVLSKMPLTSLSFGCGGCGVRAAGLEVLRGMPLTALNLDSCVYLSEEWLGVLLGLPLTSLDLGGRCDFSRIVMDAISGMPLIELGIKEMTNAGMNRLRGWSGVAKLEKLRLKVNSGDTEIVLKALKGVPMDRLLSGVKISFRIE